MRIGDMVGWQWGTGIATGEILAMYVERTEIISKGNTIVRHGKKDDPAVVIRSDNGSKVIKLAHEIQVVKGGGDV